MMMLKRYSAKEQVRNQSAYTVVSDNQKAAENFSIVLFLM